MQTVKTIKAVYTGADGSCGYERNKEYTLKVYHNGKDYIQIEKSVGGGGQCLYGSMCSFLNNWDNIRNK